MFKFLQVLPIIIWSLGFAQSQELHILYTQNTNGILKNCQCPDHPLGGMEKRATFVADWLKEYPKTLLFDSGDFLSFDGYEDNDTRMLRAVAALPYTAVNLGDQEFSNGGEFLQSNVKHISIPWIASNLKNGPVDWNIPTQRLLTVDSLNILVLGVLDSASFTFFKRIYDDISFTVVDPVESIRAIYQQVNAYLRIDSVILLSNMGFDRDRNLVGEVDFINVIIGGHSQDKFDRPVKVRNTIITQGGKNGRYLGRLDLQFKEHKLVAHSGELIPMDLSIRDDAEMLQILGD